jgi:long-chain acyl-CoA synthetase
MKLAQGEYVALEKVENIYSANPIVAQLFVYGDSLRSYLVAVLVPDPVQLANIASKVTGSKIAPTDTAALQLAIGNPKVKQEILGILSTEAKRSGLKGWVFVFLRTKTPSSFGLFNPPRFETIKRLHLTLELFSTDNGTMTPTMKIRRKDAYKLYKTELDGLYALGEPKL